jgi:hypothetical protein
VKHCTSTKLLAQQQLVTCDNGGGSPAHIAAWRKADLHTPPDKHKPAITCYISTMLACMQMEARDGTCYQRVA